MDRFEIVGKQSFDVSMDLWIPDIFILRDRQTGVLYTCLRGGGTLTALLDKNGQPILDIEASI